ncbi:MAG TPA: hypothetical protein PKE26_04775 [Kiritimatiellia bacterium]|nr:hypothetical protein [Kiritimatiellia bacterium]HMO98404.1 hypothetical protein [Kiritimatiellia bacterium]HMP96457.1 hypothetical protein [Kiritimatiellia bacterium]
MKKMIWVVAIMGVAALAGNVWAGGGCCPMSGKSKKAAYDKEGACTRALSGIELTAEQQAEIAKIEADCKAQGMTVDACSTSMSKIRDLLTDAQKEKFDAATATSSKSGKSGCGS